MSMEKNGQRIEILTLSGIPEVSEGDNIGDMIKGSIVRDCLGFQEGDIYVVTQKIVSKSEGMTVPLANVVPAKEAISISSKNGKDPRLVQLILNQSKGVVRLDEERGILIMETHHGFICANAGIDASNVPGEDTVTLLPRDSDESAKNIHERLSKMTDLNHFSVVISDTFGRPWREGHLNFAVGSYGIAPIQDYRDTVDAVGKPLNVTMVATIDIVAAAADLASGKATNTPVSIIRGLNYESSPMGINQLIRNREKDLFR